jgi:hypothetical protein
MTATNLNWEPKSHSTNWWHIRKMFSVLFSVYILLEKHFLGPHFEFCSRHCGGPRTGELRTPQRRRLTGSCFPFRCDAFAWVASVPCGRARVPENESTLVLRGSKPVKTAEWRKVDNNSKWAEKITGYEFVFQSCVRLIRNSLLQNTDRCEIAKIYQASLGAASNVSGIALFGRIDGGRHCTSTSGGCWVFLRCWRFDNSN